MADNIELAKALAESIEQYLETHRGANLSTLAKASGVGYTTLRRMAQAEGAPNQETALAVVDVVMDTEGKVAFLKRFFPRIGKMLEEAYPKNYSYKKLDDGEVQFLRREIHNLVFNLAATRAGTSEEQVRRVAGERGIAALEDLVQHNILLRDPDGRVRYSDIAYTLTDVDDILQQVQHSVSYFNKDLVGTPASAVMHLTASLNKKALHDIHNLVMEFAMKLVKLKDDPSASGEIPFYVDFIMNLYDKSTYDKKGL